MGAYENQNVVGADEDLIPLVTKLYQNYPNPFNPNTVISFSLTAKDAKNAKLVIYNLKGQKIKSFIINCPPEHVEGSVYKGIGPSPSIKLRMTQAGSKKYSVIWDGRDENNRSVSSGIYFYRLKTKDKNMIRKMIFLK